MGSTPQPPPVTRGGHHRTPAGAASDGHWRPREGSPLRAQGSSGLCAERRGRTCQMPSSGQGGLGPPEPGTPASPRPFPQSRRLPCRAASHLPSSFRNVLPSLRPHSEKEHFGTGRKRPRPLMYFTTLLSAQLRDGFAKMRSRKKNYFSS